MGAMSINISPANEAWLRSKSPGRMSGTVNVALDSYRTRQPGQTIKSIEEYSSTALARIIFSRCMGKTTPTNPIGLLTEKEYARITNAMNTIIDCIEEMDTHMVVGE